MIPFASVARPAPKQIDIPCGVVRWAFSVSVIVAISGKSCQRISPKSKNPGAVYPNGSQWHRDIFVFASSVCAANITACRLCFRGGRQRERERGRDVPNSALWRIGLNMSGACGDTESSNGHMSEKYERPNKVYCCVDCSVNVSLSISAPASHFGFVCGVSLVCRTKLIQIATYIYIYTYFLYTYI